MYQYKASKHTEIVLCWYSKVGVLQYLSTTARQKKLPVATFHVIKKSQYL